MHYKSTRGNSSANSSQEAIIKGLADDGGLFVPDNLPKLNNYDLKNMYQMSYTELAYSVLKRILDDYNEIELKRCIDNAYSTGFDNMGPAPVITLNEKQSVLELWHGPTCAFKDMALRLLPELMTTALKNTGVKKTSLILTATSGDTGKAALEGFKDVEGTKIVVFFPEHGVSDMQKLQMITQEGGNVTSIAISGNFDDAQSGVKSIFTNRTLIDELYQAGYVFSSANSINWGRLVPQIVYYISTYVHLAKSGIIALGDKINFAVPTGNFGNILAGYYAAKMGLPVKKFICASNANNVLTDFFKTGEYSIKRNFYKTYSPSMDILISSNLERLVYDLFNQDSQIISSYMNRLNETGSYTIPKDIMNKLSDHFHADYMDDRQTVKVIAEYYNRFGYLSDTHTAVALGVAENYTQKNLDKTHTVTISTASPYKFGKAVAKAVINDIDLDKFSEFEVLKMLEEKTLVKIPEPLSNVMGKPVLHKITCSKNNMADTLKKILL